MATHSPVADRLGAIGGAEQGGASFTPGPWFISNSGKLPIHVGAKDGRWKDAAGTLIAEVGGNLSVGTGNFQEDLANARLIKSAPDMLKELDEAARAFDMIARWFASIGRTTDQSFAMAQAISCRNRAAEARGEQPSVDELAARAALSKAKGSV